MVVSICVMEGMSLVLSRTQNFWHFFHSPIHITICSEFNVFCGCIIFHVFHANTGVWMYGHHELPTLLWNFHVLFPNLHVCFESVDVFRWTALDWSPLKGILDFFYLLYVCVWWSKTMYCKLVYPVHLIPGHTSLQ